MADRIILHSDLNCFYASVEVNENPKLRDQAIAVCGSTGKGTPVNREMTALSFPASVASQTMAAAAWPLSQRKY